jgi:ATP-dependent Clp protease ATP-binding subunit ClpA
MGARPLSRKIDELIRVPLSKRMLFDRLENCTITAVMAEDVVEFKIEQDAVSTVNAKGIIIV